MSAIRSILLQAPLAGVDRRLSYQSKSPFATANCMNVRADGTPEGRARVGPRPGLVKAFGQKLGGGNPVRLLSEVRYIKGATSKLYLDDFNSVQLGPQWGNLPGELGAFPVILDGYARSYDYTDTGGGVPDLWGDMSWVGAYNKYLLDGDSYNMNHSGGLSAWIQCDRPQGEAVSSNAMYQLYFALDNNSPDARSNVVIAQLATYLDGSSLFEVGKYVSGTYGPLSSFSTVGVSLPLVFRAHIDSDFKIRVYANGILLVSPFYGDNWDVSSEFSSSRSRIGFGIGSVGYGSSEAKSDYVGATYAPIAEVGSKRRVIVSAGGQLYREIGPQEIESIDATGVPSAPYGTPAMSISSDKPVRSVEHGGNLYISDYGTAYEEFDGSISSDALSSSGVSDWTTVITNEKNHVVKIFAKGATSEIGTYAISIVGATLTLKKLDGSSAGLANQASGIGFRVFRKPKYYDASANLLHDWAKDVYMGGAGSLPLGCPLIARYNGRIVQGGAPHAPHVWYMSRQDNPLDWDASQEDAQAAVSGQTSEVGVIAEPLTAIIPSLDDYLIFACEDSMYLLRGDIRQGGRIGRISGAVGIAGPDAWCWTPGSRLVFLSKIGLYAIQAGPGAVPIPLSEERIPRELVDIGSDDEAMLAYDSRGRGIHIFVSGANRVSTHFWYNLATNAFWPVGLKGDHEPFRVLLSDTVGSSTQSVILGGRDGYVRRFDLSSVQDDGEHFDSFVDIGPFRIGGNDRVDGMIHELIATLAASGGSADWQLFVADTHEQLGSLSAWKTHRIVTEDGNPIGDLSGSDLLAEGLSFSSGQWSAGRNRVNRPFARGGSAVLRLRTPIGSTTQWAYEGIVAVLERLGEQVML